MTENKIPYKIYLEESEMPQAWYNVRADMTTKPPRCSTPATGEPMTAEQLEASSARSSSPRSWTTTPAITRFRRRYAKFLQDV